MEKALYGKLRGMFSSTGSGEKNKTKTPQSFIQILAILAAIQACLQATVRHSSAADRERSHDLFARGEDGCSTEGGNRRRLSSTDE